METVYIVDGARTPIGRYGGSLSAVRVDDLAAKPISALKERHTDFDWSLIDDVILGCANQAGEDNRNIGRMASLLSGLPHTIPGSTVNRLCGSGLDAVALAARSIATGEMQAAIAGGVEGMTRAPFVMGKSQTPFGRAHQLEDTTMGWRFVNQAMEKTYGTDTMPETAENLAEKYQITRADQDAFALNSQTKAHRALEKGRFDRETISVTVPLKKGQELVFDRDEHPRMSTPEGLAKLRPVVRPDGTVTAGNASGINDGAAALLLVSETVLKEHQITPLAKVKGASVAGVEPKIMGIGPVPATKKLLDRLGLSLDQMDVIELNEAFAAQSLAVIRQWGLADDAPQINPNGGAIALGHPLGMSGARLALTAAHELQESGGTYALCTMCIGVGQGIAMVLERA